MSQLVRIYAITKEGERQPIYCDGLVLQFSCGSELEVFGSTSNAQCKGVVLRSGQAMHTIADEQAPERPPANLGIQALGQNILNVFLERQSTTPRTTRFSSASRLATAAGTLNK